MTKYELNVKNRSLVRFVLGLLARLKLRVAYDRRIRRMRAMGATIGEGVVVGKDMKFAGFRNLTIGNHCSLQSGIFDTRASVVIGNNVIVGRDVEIMTCSHDIDSPEWDLKTGGIEIDDYVWIATGATILPSCRKIGRGAVIGAKSVVVKDVPPMAVVSGNPGTILRFRACVHENIVPESYLGGDFHSYKMARKTN